MADVSGRSGVIPRMESKVRYLKVDGVKLHRR